jgi:hypothetical protein
MRTLAQSRCCNVSNFEQFILNSFLGTQLAHAAHMRGDPREMAHDVQNCSHLLRRNSRSLEGPPKSAKAPKKGDD